MLPSQLSPDGDPTPLTLPGPYPVSRNLQGDTMVVYDPYSACPCDMSRLGRCCLCRSVPRETNPNPRYLGPIPFPGTSRVYDDTTPTTPALMTGGR